MIQDVEQIGAGGETGTFHNQRLIGGGCFPHHRGGQPLIQTSREQGQQPAHPPAQAPDAPLVYLNADVDASPQVVNSPQHVPHSLPQQGTVGHQGIGGSLEVGGGRFTHAPHVDGQHGHPGCQQGFRKTVVQPHLLAPFVHIDDDRHVVLPRGWGQEHGRYLDAGLTLEHNPLGEEPLVQHLVEDTIFDLRPGRKRAQHRSHPVQQDGALSGPGISVGRQVLVRRERLSQLAGQGSDSRTGHWRFSPGEAPAGVVTREFTPAAQNGQVGRVGRCDIGKGRVVGLREVVTVDFGHRCAVSFALQPVGQPPIGGLAHGPVITVLGVHLDQVHLPFNVQQAVDVLDVGIDLAHSLDGEHPVAQPGNDAQRPGGHQATDI